MKRKDIILTAILCIVTCVAAYFLVSQGVNVNVKYSGTAPSVQVATEPSSTPSQTESTTALPVTDSNPDTEEPTLPVTNPTDESTKSDSGLPQTPAEILNKYSELMNTANELRVGYNKVEYQAIPPEKATFSGNIMNSILPLTSMFFKDEETARANPETFEKGGDMYWFPLYKVQKGCLLTDASKIKTAECTELPDGNVKISIVLNDELNSEPIAEGATSCESSVGSMFTPVEKATVDETLKTNFAVKTIIRDLDYTLTYYDCTADLVYNPTTNQIVSVDQYMHILITVNSGKVIGIDVTGTAVLDNYMYLSDFVY